MKAALKQLVLRGAELTGLAGRVGNSSWRRNQLLILCYHGVSIRDEHEFNPELFVSPSHLRARLALLGQLGARVLPLDEALKRLHEGRLPHRAVVITFDDGLADFATHAVPVLRDFGVPATVYVTTYYVQHQRPVWNVAARYLAWRASEAGSPDAARLAALLGVPPEAIRARPRDVIAGFIERWRDATSIEQDEAVTRLAEALGVEDQPMRQARLFHLMSPEQVAALPSDLVSVQLHTHRHRQPHARGAFAAEIRENQARLADMVGYQPVHYCYPSGEVRPELPGVLRDMGIASATTCIPGLVRRTDDPLLAPRLIDTMRTPDSTFRGWVSGTAALLRRR